MNTTKLLSDALFASPDDFTLAGTLRDHLFGDLEYVYSEAEKQVDRIILAGRYARDLASAAELVKPGAKLRGYILGAICSAADILHARRVTVFLVAGEQAPVVKVGPTVIRGVTHELHNVTIGATRVLRIARAHDIKQAPARLRGEFLVP